MLSMAGSSTIQAKQLTICAWSQTSFADIGQNDMEVGVHCKL